MGKPVTKTIRMPEAIYRRLRERQVSMVRELGMAVTFTDAANMLILAALDLRDRLDKERPS
jgi:hypothetical protein